MENSEGGVPHKEHTSYRSRYAINEQVQLDFGSGNELYNCIVQGVQFTESKVFYDIGIVSQVDGEMQVVEVLFDIDSVFVKDLEV